MEHKEISAIVVDFGSTNSGCCRVCSHDAEGNLVFSNPEFLQNIGSYAKDNTWFYVEPSFLERIRTDYDTLTDDDFRIESRIMPNTDNPNIIWGREAIKRHSNKISEEHWVSFKRFKMMLYYGNENYAGLDFPLLLIIKTFLRVMKIECLELESKRLGRNVKAEEILWGVTIPSIWTDENKRVMVSLAHEVFTPQTRILSEPEGPLVYSLLMSSSQGKVEYQDNRITFFADMGGGTTDICLMKECLKNDGSWQVEMVANTDGQAAGGNDIDNDFILFLLRKISKERVSDSGVSYDSLSDEDLFDLLFAGFQANVGDFIEFENNWFLLKNRPDLLNLTDCPFTFTKDYRKWLMANGHKAVANVVGEYLVDGCSFSAEEFKKKIYAPTFNKICAKIREILQANKGNVSIDRVVLAGGMSCDELINSIVRNAIKDTLGGSSMIADMGPLMKGGAIAAGACYLLINEDFVVRLAKRYFFYNFSTSTVTSVLVSQYEELGKRLRIGDISTLMDDEDQYAIRGSIGNYSVLGPITIKDMLVKKFIDPDLSSREEQTSLKMTFYSSDDIVIYANDDNPKLKVEAIAEFECKPETRYELEVDFNEAQISNALRYVLREYDTKEVVSEGYLNNAIKQG